MKRLSLLLMMVFFAVGIAFAQRTITGTVTDGTDPVIGASVLVKGTTVGTITDADGNFSLAVPEGSKALVFSYLGLTAQEIALGADNIVSVSLKEDAQALTEVVVSAQGIAREKKTLGYATTSVSAEDIANKPETDIGRALAGKSPGVVITGSSGLAGSGTKINIRGVSSVSGNTQPLWVVDGVPVNTKSNENNDFRDGNVTPTRNLDLDPNNIESMSILRGLSATTLYGSEGRNGVILVTTKTGANGKSSKQLLTASVSQSYNVINAVVPEFQNKWGNGFDGDYGEFFSNWGTPFTVSDKNGVARRHPYYEHRLLLVDHPLAKEFADATGYVPKAQPNNVSDFFQQGTSATTSVNVGMNTGIASFNVNFSRLDETGYIKNNGLTRNNFNLGGSANLTKKWKVMGTFNYVNTNFKTPPVAAGLGSNSDGGPSVFANLFYTPRNIDLTNWPYQNPLTGASLYYRNNNSITNPYWILDNSSQTSNTNRFFGTLSTTYQLLDWANITYRLGIDTYNEAQSYYSNKGAVGFPTDLSQLGTGFLRTTSGNNTITDQSIIVGINKKINDDFDVTSNIGVNSRIDTYDQTGMESIGQVVFGILNHSNFTANSNRDFRRERLNKIENKTILGAFADVTVGYKNYLYVNLQARNDLASTHEKPYRSLLYPGASISFLPTSAFPGLKQPWLDLVKLRAGYGTSANFARPYSTRPYLSLNANSITDAVGNVITLATPLLLSNPDLKPELLTETELGMEAQSYNGRLSLDLSFYNRVATDQIVKRDLDPATGYTSSYINAGSISNKGVELGLKVTPLQFENFELSLGGSFTKNISKVEKLPEGSKEILISGYSNLGNFAIEGQPYGVIKGTYVEKNANGDLLTNDNGDYVIAPEVAVIGDPNPDWLATGTAEIRLFKAVSLSGAFDFVKGGQIFSFSAATLIGRGVAKELEDFNPQLPVILPGISKETGKVNDIPMPASGVFFGNTIIGGGANDRGIYDATRARLREVALRFDLPKSLLGNSAVKGANLSFTGNNIWFRAFNTVASSKVDADRTAFGTGNGAGFDFLGGPSATRYGANLKITF
jgi:TonB-linked SusC/RagA family outer membrane protein